MADPIPVVGTFGAAPTPELNKAVLDTMQLIMGRLNEVPIEAVPNIITSVLISFCANQDEPLWWFASITRQVGAKLSHLVNEPVGHA